MTLEELYRDAIRAKEKDSPIGVSLHFGKGFKRPAGFPRGQLLNETARGSLYAFNADKIIEWVKKHGGNKRYNYGFVSGMSSYCRLVKKFVHDIKICPLEVNKRKD